MWPTRSRSEISATAGGSGRSSSIGTSSSAVHSGTPVVRNDAARRPGTEKSKIVGSSSWPIRGAEAARPPGAAVDLLEANHWMPIRSMPIHWMTVY